MKIAVDAMGGDAAPSTVVKGAVNAVEEESDITIILVGDEGQIRDQLEGVSYDEDQIHVQHAPDVIGMAESAVEAIRSKPKSSINVGVQLLKKGVADALVSAGNTGATVSASTLNLGLMEQIHRPGIASPVPHESGVCSLIDVGANIHCKPHQLLQYGIMATVFQRTIYDKDNPAVGLLNIGEEEEKGNELLQETFPLLKQSPLHFIGNVEGPAAFSGEVDVLITEGFMGNVILKFLEGCAHNVLNFVQQQMRATGEGDDLSRRDQKILQTVKRETDYSEHGGAPLLGVDGICIICHGRSGEKAIRNAIRQAGRLHRHRINESILTEIQEIEENLDTVQSD